MISAAAIFAAEAHASIGQVRKYTGEPYVVHPRAVAALVAEAGGDDSMVAAAWLHDVVEDTPVALDDIRQQFGDDIADLVFWLTDISRPEDGNRASRKAIDRAHLAQAPARAKAVKLADLIDNSASILAHDPNFAVVYLREKAALLEILADAAVALPAASILFHRAQQVLRDAQETMLQGHLAKMGM